MLGCLATCWDPAVGDSRELAAGGTKGLRPAEGWELGVAETVLIFLDPRHLLSHLFHLFVSLPGSDGGISFTLPFPQRGRRRGCWDRCVPSTQTA